MYLMLEGQVAVLSSGMLADADALMLLEALRESQLYREDQHSYMLYPDREIAPFLSRNTLPAGWRERCPLLAATAAAGENALIALDREGNAHFQADLTNAGDLGRRLDALAAPPRDREAVLAIWEEIFHHSAFTGRSGTFFMFEGLGSIYWHMVAKLLVAVQECHAQAGDPAARARLQEAYCHIRDGLGFRKTPEVYGAFPTDPYSHTPRDAGAAAGHDRPGEGGNPHALGRTLRRRRRLSDLRAAAAGRYGILRVGRHL